MNISTQTISRFLQGPDIQLPTVSYKIDHPRKEMRKVNTNKIRLDDNIVYFHWISRIIVVVQEEDPWVVGLLHGLQRVL